VSHKIEVNGQRHIACVEYHVGGTPAELFLDGLKPGSAMAAVLQDAAVAVSVALQHGVPARQLAKSMSRRPSLAWQPSAEPASVIGAALDLMDGLEQAV
jgi:hypothetical protein